MVLEIQSLANKLARLDISFSKNIFSFGEARLSLMEHIQDHQFDDERLRVIWNKVLSGEAKMVYFYPESIMRISGHIYVFRVGDWVRLILEEASCL